MDETYEIVLDTFLDEPAIEQAIAAAMTLSDAEHQYIEAGAPVSKSIPECLKFKYRVKVDSDGLVWFEMADR